MFSQIQGANSPWTVSSVIFSYLKKKNFPGQIIDEPYNKSFDPWPQINDGI